MIWLLIVVAILGFVGAGSISMVGGGAGQKPHKYRDLLEKYDPEDVFGDPAKEGD